MHLRNPGAIDEAIAALHICIQECGNLYGQFMGAWEPRAIYAHWVDDTYAQLDNHFADSGLAEGLHSVRYWQIVQLDKPSLLLGLLRQEMEAQTRRLKRAIEKLEGFKQFACREGQIVIPDTSAFTKGVYFTDFDWASEFALGGSARLVVPILVVEELDRVKSFERGKAQDRARSVLKKLREVMRTVDSGQAARLRDGVTIEVFIDDDWHQRRYNNDGEIIDQALTVRDLTAKDVLLVCVDAAMEFRAREHGLKVAAMPEPNEP